MNAPPPVASTCGPLSSNRAMTRASPLRKYGFAVTGKNIGDAHTGGFLNLRIGIDKRDRQPGGEPAADRRFADPHHADEHDRAPSEAGHDCGRRDGRIGVIL